MICRHVIARVIKGDPIQAYLYGNLQGAYGNDEE
jgi:hypothetical protein